MRATTAKLRKRLSAVMMSSTMPSLNQLLLGFPAEVGEGQHRQPRDRGRVRRGFPACRHHETVADARDRQDPVPPVVGLAERLAQRGDLHGQVALLDDGVGPGAGEEVGLAHGASGGRGQGREHREGALAEAGRGTVAQQGAARGVENERTEGESPVCHARA